MNHDILLVDDDPGAIQLMARMLAGLGRLRFATSGAMALGMVRASAPDLILLDAEMPGMSGFEVCRELQADPALASIPVIFVTSHSDTKTEVAGFELGAADFISKPISEPLVVARVKTQLRIKRLTDELRRLSTIDALTGVANRRRFDETLVAEWQRARRSGDSLCLLIVDVDHFKRFNDTYGHPAGDAALCAVARALTESTQRTNDLISRFGGEEFAMLLPCTPRAGGKHVAHRVVQAVAAMNLPHAASPTAPCVTVSVGMSCYDEDSACWITASPDSLVMGGDQRRRTAQELLKAADEALYAAKRAGRARAYWLDVSDVDEPARAQPVGEMQIQGASPHGE
ncbi:diguanylate cyclase [Ideonella sp.]|uniref:diguanylate cyclase n=1 Tax=Ideonella sp. TaxID=1929293 RepID=UPI0035B0D130